MSLVNAKAQLLTALQAVTWTVPTSAQGITSPNYAAKTGFSRIDTQQAGGGDSDISETDFPYCRIYVPDLPEQRYTDGGDAASYKNQIFDAYLFVYMAGYAKDWQGLGDYFDTVLDATMAHFRRNGSPQPGIVSPGDNDHVVAWGLRQQARPSLPDLFGEVLSYRATVAITVRMTIV